MAFLVALANRPEVQRLVAARGARTPDELSAQVAEGSRWLLLDDGAPASTVGLRTVNERSRIASLFGLAVDPARRGRGIARGGVAELVGWASTFAGCTASRPSATASTTGRSRSSGRRLRRGGRPRRRAWWRHSTWHDGVRFALLADDPAPARRHKRDVRNPSHSEPGTSRVWTIARCGSHCCSSWW